ncbi:hypothetical protein KEJ32_07445 [Candidatus Bathyarchaeota archaeon]|nr:hypothetical protein [Candidatus Bathyarchaeota archaeon]
MPEERPTAAFVLSLIGGILILLGGIASAILAGMLSGAIMLVPFLGGLGALVIIIGILGLIFGIIILIGAVMINSGEPSKVRTGSIIVLIFSILSLFIGGGFIIGFILALVGSILGLVWKPSGERGRLPPPPP